MARGAIRRAAAGREPGVAIILVFFSSASVRCFFASCTDAFPSVTSLLALSVSFPAPPLLQARTSTASRNNAIRLFLRGLLIFIFAPSDSEILFDHDRVRRKIIKRAALIVLPGRKRVRKKEAQAPLSEMMPIGNKAQRRD